MKALAIAILLPWAFLAQSRAGDAQPFAPAEPYHFSTNQPACFFADHLTGATYTKFSPDGQYVRIAKEHMGVWPFDHGSWTQSGDGTLTLISTNLCADILCGPLVICVGRHDRVGRLADLRGKIAGLLASNPQDHYGRADLKSLAAGKYALKVEIDWRTRKNTVTRTELLALLEATGAFLNDSSVRNQRLMPLAYKDKVFLVDLNGLVNRDPREVCDAIDQGPDAQVISYAHFMVSEAQFDQGTGKPYPFKFYPAMNRLTGAE